MRERRAARARVTRLIPRARAGTRPSAIWVRLLFAALYAAPAVVPPLATLFHAADHRIAEAKRDLAWGLSHSYDDDFDAAAVHTHPHVGTHRHDSDSGHGATVLVLLGAADALDQEAEADDAPPPLQVAPHLPPSKYAAAELGDPVARPSPPLAHITSLPGAAPPKPPPRA